MAKLHGFGKLLAVHANRPGKEAGRFDFGLAVLVHSAFVAAGQSVKREAPVLVQANEMVMPLGRICGFSVQGIGYVLHEEGTIAFEVRAQVAGPRTDSLIDDAPLTRS